MALQWVFIAVLATITSFSEACTGRYGVTRQPWLPSPLPDPIVTCTFLCPQTQKETWSDARDECLGDKADLMTVNAEEELNNLIANNRDFVWIGLQDADGDGNFEWADGSEGGFINWASGFPKSDPNKTCVAVTPQGMVNANCAEKYNFFCERGLCQEYGGTCLNKARRCCKTRMFQSVSECSGDPSMMCCKEFESRTGGGDTNRPIPDKPVKCSSRHQECLCDIMENYAYSGSSLTPFTPAYHITNGCINGSALERESECGDPQYVCLKHRILNLLKCYYERCADAFQITDLINHDVVPGNKNFCNGNCVRIARVQPCPLEPLKQMCSDIMGTSSETQIGPFNFFTCCF